VAAQPLLAAVAPDRLRERPVVGARDDVDRSAEQRSLYGPLLLERARQVGEAEAVEPRPEPDVGGGGVLRLQAADPFQGSDERRARAAQEELPGEQRPVQLARRERPQGITAAFR
jgi:hypothetical protein